MRQFVRTHQVEGYSFSKQTREIDRKPELQKEPPGPGHYDPTLPKSGTSQPMLFGPERKADKISDQPAPGSYDPVVPKEAPEWSFGKPPDQKRSKEE